MLQSYYIFSISWSKGTNKIMSVKVYVRFNVKEEKPSTNNY